MGLLPRRALAANERPMRRALLDFIGRPRCMALVAIWMQWVMACGIRLGIAVPVVVVLYGAVLARNNAPSS